MLSTVIRATLPNYFGLATELTVIRATLLQRQGSAVHSDPCDTPEISQAMGLLKQQGKV